MKIQGGEIVNLTKVLYVPQVIKKFLIVSSFISKGATIGDDQDKNNIKKNGVNMILDARKVRNASVMFYLKKKLYVPEGQVALSNIQEEKKYGNEEK